MFHDMDLPMSSTIAMDAAGRVVLAGTGEPFDAATAIRSERGRQSRRADRR